MADVNYFNKPIERHIIKQDFTSFEKNDCVERAGYVPLRNQIQAFREAGVLLKATRALQYDVNDDGSKALDTINPIFTSGGVDYSDMSELSRRQEALGKVIETVRQSKESLSSDLPNAEKSEDPVE